MAQIISKEVIEVVQYGRFKIETSKGEVEFSYGTGEDGGYYEVEKGEEIYNQLSDEESDEIYDLMTFELNK